MKISSNLYTPKQVADLYSIKKDTLLFYDRIGLFQPDVRKANGYRLYSSSKLVELEAILSLKDLGFSLESIRSAIEGLTVNSFLDTLEQEIGALEEKIAALKTRQSVTKSLHQRIKDAVTKQEGVLYLDSFPAVNIHITKVEDESPYTDNETWQRTYNRMIDEAGGHNISAAGSIIALEDALAGNPYRCRAIYGVSAKRTGAAIPAGRYAYLYFHGPYKDVERHYASFFKRLEEAGLRPQGEIYEELSVSTLVTRDEAAFITQIRVRVDG